MSSSFFRFVVFLLFFNTSIYSAQRITKAESVLLFPLFQSLLKYTEAGYVLYDQKPVCVHGFSSNTCIFEPSEWHQVSVAICETKKILENDVFKKGNIVFCFDEQENIIIINRKLFLKTIQDNLILFQYVLGPSITPDSLLTTFIESQKPFISLLNYDKVLIGIVLGYGVQNALHVSRNEEIQEIAFSYDVPPFSPKVNSCLREKEKEILLFFPTVAEEERVSEFEETVSKKIYNKKLPSFGFNSLKEEQQFLSNKIRYSSQCLQEEEANFIFGCIEEEVSNIIPKLESTQKKIKGLLNSISFVPDILEMICGEKITIEEGTLSFSAPEKEVNLAAAKLLKKNLERYEEEYLPYFAQGLLENEEDILDRGNSILGFSESLKNIKTAKKNLEISNKFFCNLNKDKNTSSLFDNYLYYKMLHEGYGPNWQGETKVCVSYEIFDPSGRCLVKEDKISLDLREVIPGFAHGLQKMRIGEKRLIYIHPALAYGVHTYLDKGIYLLAQVELIDIEETIGDLPSLTPMDLSMICSENFQQSCEEEHKKNLRYIGMLRGRFLRKCADIDIHAVLKAFNSLKGDVELTQEDKESLNNVFWQHYFANSQ